MNKVFSFFRIAHLKLAYPYLTIDFSTRIERNCKVECDNGARMVINKSYISSGTYLSAKHSGEVIIKNSFIGRNSVIVSVDKIEIESNCLIAEMVVIRDQDHIYNNNSTLIKKQGVTSSPILIKENVWLANKVTVLKGVTIGEHTVIGAHALVNKSIDSNSVAVGIPAKVVKE